MKLNGRAWSNQDYEFLKQNASKLTSDLLASKLNRSEASVLKKASLLKVSVKHKKKIITRTYKYKPIQMDEYEKDKAKTFMNALDMIKFKS